MSITQERVLGLKPLPNIREDFSEVCREESRKKVMMGSQNATPTIENSALAAPRIQHHSNDNRQKKGRPCCDHYRRPRHTKETY